MARQERPVRVKGKLTTWNDDRGYGFITPTHPGKQIFVHIKAFANPRRRPELNQFVSYDLSVDERGRAVASNAVLAGDRQRRDLHGKQRRWSGVIAAGFLIIVGVATLAGAIPAFVLYLYLGASVASYLVYARDKRAAATGAWRTKESGLHLLSLFGGWPGALVAQQTLRHKSAKQSFRALFWFTVLMNCGALGWLCTPSGAEKLEFVTERIVRPLLDS